MSVALLILNAAMASMSLLIFIVVIIDEVRDLRFAIHRPQRWLINTSIATYVLFSAQPVIVLVSIIFFKHNVRVYCERIVTASYALWWLGKGMYAAIFILRLHAMGKISVSLAYSDQVIRKLLLFQLVSTAAVSFLWSYEHVKHSYIRDMKCILTEPTYIIVITAVYDTGFG